MAELLNIEQQGLLGKKLVDAFLTIGGLQDWLIKHLPSYLRYLSQGSLNEEMPNLMMSSLAEDGMWTLLQQLVDHPPLPDIPGIIFAFTMGEIKAQARKSSLGLPPVQPHENWLVAGRPFVNRKSLRDHLKKLDDSEGAESVLIIDGDKLTGKSFSVTFAMSFDTAKASPEPLDLSAWTSTGTILDARALATTIAGDEQGCPPFDLTKENEAVPHLMRWLAGKLKGKNIWVIIDHCNQRVLTDGAHRILIELAKRLRDGYLANLRLILVDFDRNELPMDWRDLVRYDHSALPDEKAVKEWCESLAMAAKRRYLTDAPAQWAKDVFSGLSGSNYPEGLSEGARLERQLNKTLSAIQSCEEL